jgi:hypothetical protein
LPRMEETHVTSRTRQIGRTCLPHEVMFRWVNCLGVQRGLCVRLTTSPPSVSRLFRKCGILNTPQRYRHPRPITRMALVCPFSSIPSNKVYEFRKFIINFKILGFNTDTKHCVLTSSSIYARVSQITLSLQVFPKPIYVWFQLFTAVLMKNAVSGMLRRVALVRTDVSEELSPPSLGWKETASYEKR